MTRSDQSDFFAVREKNILLHIKNFSRTKDPEELHGLRVEIKKIKALKQMLEKSSKDIDFQDALSPLKTVFKNAGEIREKILISKLLDKYHVKNEKFRNELRHSVAVNSEKFRAREKIYLKIVRECGLFLPEKFQKVARKKIPKAYKKEIKKLDDFFSSPENEKYLHEKRKKIKMLLYFSHALPKKISKEISLNEKYLDKLQEKMGDWHDVILAGQILKSAGIGTKLQAKKISGEEKKLLAQVRSLSKNFKKKCR